MTPSSRPLRTGDGLGIINSALCLAHCLAMPVFIAMGASFIHHPAVGWAFVVLAFVAVRSAVRGRNKPMAALLLGIGWAVFAMGIALEGAYHELELLTYLGSGLLIIGHILNWLDLKPWNGAASGTMHGDRLGMRRRQSMNG